MAKGRARVVVVGSANVDLIMKSDRLPRPGETITSARFSRAFGGKGANQAVAVARSCSGASPGMPVGDRVTFIASVGQDSDGSDMVESWRESGIDTSRVSTSHSHTGCASIMIGGDGENMIVAAPGANDDLTATRVEASAASIAEADYLLLQFEIPEESVRRSLQIAREHGTPVVWNLAPMRSRPDRLLRDVRLVVVNETEAELITGVPVGGTDSAGDAARSIIDLGAKAAIVTLGRRGSVIATGSDSSHVPAFAASAVDTTAAGDTYCGCLVCALAEGMDLLEAIRFASAGAAISVGRLGAQPSVPWRSEIDDFLSSR